MATRALRTALSFGARQKNRHHDRNAAAKRSLKTRLRVESLEDRIVLSSVTMSAAAALQYARDVQASLSGNAAEVSRVAAPATIEERTMLAFGSRCNYDWADDTPHGCSTTWCETPVEPVRVRECDPPPECDPNPECEPVPLRQNGNGCEPRCDGQVPGTANRYGCETDAWCEGEMRREWCEREEWCEERPRCEERPPCDSAPTVASYEGCQERPNCDVRRECDDRRECDTNQTGIRSRGKESCDPCTTSEVRRRSDRGESCEVERRCETVRRCDPTPNCDDNVPAVASKNGQSANTVQASTSQQSDTSAKVARAVEKCFGDAGLAKQMSSWW